MNIEFSRRGFLHCVSAGAGLSASGWLHSLARAAAMARPPQRSRILLWMSGGASQIDTFDMKPGSDHGGPFEAIATNVTGVRISEHLPRLAARMQQLALVRSMTSRESEHGQASFFAHTGYPQRGPVQYPTLGALVARQLEQTTAQLPDFVSIAPFRALNASAHAPGFLGPRYAALTVGEAGTAYGQMAAKALEVENLTAPEHLSNGRASERWQLARTFQNRFATRHPGNPVASHLIAYERARRLMDPKVAKVFRLEDETDKVRAAYGRNPFGQGCLLARRLVENRVRFIEVSMGGASGLDWDTHTDNFARVKTLSAQLDAAWSQLLADLDERGLLDSTLIVWMGEFGRTPRINSNTGRDHFASAWSTALAGAGISGGQVVGKTSKNGTDVTEDAVPVPAFLATILAALGIDPTSSNLSNTGRPVPLVEEGTRPLRRLLR